MDGPDEVQFDGVPVKPGSTSVSLMFDEIKALAGVGGRGGTAAPEAARLVARTAIPIIALQLQRLVEGARQYAKSVELPEQDVLSVGSTGAVESFDDSGLRGALGRVNALLGREPLAGLRDATEAVMQATKGLGGPAAGMKDDEVLREVDEGVSDDEGDDGLVAEASPVDGLRRRSAQPPAVATPAGSTSRGRVSATPCVPAAKKTPHRPMRTPSVPHTVPESRPDTDAERQTRSVLKGQRKPETFDQQLLLTATSLAEYIAQQRRMVEVAAALADPEAGVEAALSPPHLLAGRARAAIADSRAESVEADGSEAAATARGRELSLGRQRSELVTSLSQLALAGRAMVERFNQGDRPSAWLQGRESAVSTRLRTLTARAKQMEEAHASYTSIVASGGSQAVATQTAIQTFLASRHTAATMDTGRAIEQAVMFTAESISEEAERSRRAMEEAAFRSLQVGFSAGMRGLLAEARPQVCARVLAFASSVSLVVTVALGVLILATGGVSVVTQILGLLHIDPTCLELGAGTGAASAASSSWFAVPAIVAGAQSVWAAVSCWWLPVAVGIILIALCIGLPAVGTPVTAWLLAAALVYGLLADLRLRYSQGILLPPIAAAAGLLAVVQIAWGMLEAARFARLLKLQAKVRSSSVEAIREQQMDAASAVAESDAASLSFAALLAMPTAALVITLTAGLLVGDALTCPGGSICMLGMSRAAASAMAIGETILLPFGVSET